MASGQNLGLRKFSEEASEKKLYLQNKDQRELKEGRNRTAKSRQMNSIYRSFDAYAKKSERAEKESAERVAESFKELVEEAKKIQIEISDTTRDLNATFLSTLQSVMQAEGRARAAQFAKLMTGYMDLSEKMTIIQRNMLEEVLKGNHETSSRMHRDFERVRLDLFNIRVALSDQFHQGYLMLSNRMDAFNAGIQNLINQAAQIRQAIAQLGQDITARINALERNVQDQLRIYNDGITRIDGVLNDHVRRIQALEGQLAACNCGGGAAPPAGRPMPPAGGFGGYGGAAGGYGGAAGGYGGAPGGYGGAPGGYGGAPGGYGGAAGGYGGAPGGYGGAPGGYGGAPGGYGGAAGGYGGAPGPRRKSYRKYAELIAHPYFVTNRRFDSDREADGLPPWVAPDNSEHASYR